MVSGEVSGERPVEGLSGAAVVFAGGSVDEKGEVFAGKLEVREFLSRDGADEGDVLVEEEADVVEGFVAVELDDVDKAFIDEVSSEGARVVDEDADAEDVACDVGGNGGGFLGRAVSLGGWPEIDAEGGDSEISQVGGVGQGGDATNLKGRLG